MPEGGAIPPYGAAALPACFIRALQLCPFSNFFDGDSSGLHISFPCTFTLQGVELQVSAQERPESVMLQAYTA